MPELRAVAKLIDPIAGLRPNFMKIAPVIDAMRVAEQRGGQLRSVSFIAGQHYDYSMGLRVDAPRALEAGTMAPFAGWHELNVRAL